MQRVVITGIGIYSTIGTDLDKVRDSLYNGKSGIGFESARKEFGFRSALTGIIEKPQLKGVLDRRTRIMLPEQGEYAYMATTEALKHSRMDEEYLDKHIVGILYGNDSSSSPIIESNDIVREKKDTQLLGSGYIFQSMNSTVTMNLATIFKLKGVNFTISAACASGSHSIGIGYVLIKNGLSDAIICGGAQEVNLQSMASFDGLGVFSTRESDPIKASRPFDKNRDGLVPSGGAATVILESYENAVKRGAPILAEVLGYGFSSNAAHISQPTVEGPARSISMALQEAGLKAKDLDYINAHATSTPIGDAHEAKAIYSVIGDLPIPVSSTKSMTGHECWMAGASEVVYSMLMMQNDFVAPNINFELPDEDSAKLFIAANRLERNIDVFLSNSFGFGGTNSTLIIKKFKP